MIEILQDFGYAGMFVASFLAGSVFPFRSEAVMTALSLAGLNIWALLAYSTVGNTLGGMFNYGIGRLGNEDWMYRLFRFEEERVTKAKKWVRSYGAWMGLLSWIPIIGSVITVSMGLLRVNFSAALLATFLGKFLRYLVLTAFLSLF